MNRYLTLLGDSDIEHETNELSQQHSDSDIEYETNELSAATIPSPKTPKETAAQPDPWAALQVGPKRFNPWAAHQGDKTADGQCPVCEGHDYWMCADGHDHCEMCYPIRTIVCKLFFRYSTEPDDLQAGRDIAAGKTVAKLPEPVNPIPI